MLGSVLLLQNTAEAQRRRRPGSGRRPTSTQTQSTGSEGNSSANADSVSAPAQTSSTDVTSSSSTTTSPNAVTATTAPSADTSGTSADSTGAPTVASPESRLAALDVALSGRWFARIFAYNQDLFGELRNYSLLAAPLVNANVEWYPGAHFTQGVGAYFGIVGSVSLPFAISSRDSAGTQYATSALAFDAGIRGRFPIASHELGVHVTYGQQRYALDNRAGGSPTGMDPGVPAVGYQNVRPGLSARLALGERAALLVGASALIVLSAGEIAEQYFSRASVYGLEAQLGLAIKVFGGLELRVLTDARRYVYAMRPMVQDRWIAGGALDHYFSAGLAIAYRR